jgi:AraC-like DNA-binding protein
MKPTFRKLTIPNQRSFVLRSNVMPLSEAWHYHPEVEIYYSHHGRGKFFIGDSIEQVNEGELFLIGSNLPHSSQRDASFYDQNPEQPEPFSIVIQFLPTFLGENFFELPEFKIIQHLLQRAKRGLIFDLRTWKEMSQQILDLKNHPPHKQVLFLLDILTELSNVDSFRYLSSELFVNTYNNHHHAKLNKVYEYTYENFTQPVSLEKVADLACLTPTGFCRFFKKRTGKTYFEFLAELRIALSCKLLAENQMIISAIAYDCGFQNVSLFNRQFKEIKGCTPTEYQMRLGRG